jgi:transcriptional regulator with XRE-family HTH domain
MSKPGSFGQYVKATRQQKGVSGRQLAKLVGVANTTVIDIEDGAVPSPALFLDLIDALDLDITTASQLIEPYKRLYARIIAAREGRDRHG